MKLAVPTNWQSDLIKKIKGPSVDVVYGKLDVDFIGGGRPSFMLLKVTKRKAQSHICEIHKEGLKFYYLLNASCMGNREWTRTGHRELNKLLDWLSEAKVDGLVVASPYLLQYIKRRYPHFEISISCFAGVNSVEKAKFWEGLGASIITLSYTELNRDFRLLRGIRNSVSCELQLIANGNCIHDCPIFFYHKNIGSHSSQSNKSLGSFMFDFCHLICRYKRIVEPMYFICGTWIRPEDLAVYENIGISNFKLTDRTMHTDAIALIVDAYSKRSYKGNLYDLFNSPSKSLWCRKANLIHMLKYFFHPFSVNIFRMMKHRKVVKDIKIYIDNTKLDGFISYFFNKDCRYESCRECGYCQEIADKVVAMPPGYEQKTISDYRIFLDEIISGEIFRY